MIVTTPTSAGVPAGGPGKSALAPDENGCSTILYALHADIGPTLKRSKTYAMESGSGVRLGGRTPPVDDPEGPFQDVGRRGKRGFVRRLHAVAGTVCPDIEVFGRIVDPLVWHKSL
jgi:hypothetical protein